MTALSQAPLRLRMAATAALVAAVAAGLVPLAEMYGGPAMWAVAGVVASLVAGLAAWTAFAPVSRVAAAAAAVREGQSHVAFPAAGELRYVGETLADLEERHDALTKRYHADLKAMIAAVTELGDPRTGAVSLTLVAPFPAADQLTKTFNDFARSVLAVRQRLALSIRILQGLPNPVMVTDASGALRYMNGAAETLFGVASGKSFRQPLVGFLGGPSPWAEAGHDPQPTVQGVREVSEWLRAGTGGTIVAVGRDAQQRDFPLELTASVPLGAGRDVLICLLGRDLTEVQRREAAERAAIRANVCRQFVGKFLEETEESVRQVAAQTRLLTGDAKQSGQRDAMLPKLGAINQGLNRIDAFARSAHWFEQMCWGEPPPPTPSEFTAGEVVAIVRDRLAGRFKSRSNSLKVIDQGAWLFADAEWLEAALTGLLLHTCDAATGGQVELRVRRLPASDGRIDPQVEFHLLDGGPALTGIMLAAIDEPFGGMQAAPLDRFEGVGGFPLGLVVARRLAIAMGGELRLAADSSGQLDARLFLPTRVHTDPVESADIPAVDYAPVEETVAGWRLGRPAGSNLERTATLA